MKSKARSRKIQQFRFSEVPILLRADIGSDRFYGKITGALRDLGFRAEWTQYGLKVEPLHGSSAVTN